MLMHTFVLLVVVTCTQPHGPNGRMLMHFAPIPSFNMLSAAQVCLQACVHALRLRNIESCMHLSGGSFSAPTGDALGVLGPQAMGFEGCCSVRHPLPNVAREARKCLPDILSSSSSGRKLWLHITRPPAAATAKKVLPSTVFNFFFCRARGTQPGKL